MEEMEQATSNPNSRGPPPVSPMSTLPIEVLDQVITEVVTENRSAISTLMCLSQFWHDVIVQRPLLWAKVELNLSRSEESFSLSYRVAQRCIDRSGSVDLDVTIRIQRGTGSCPCARIFDNCAKCGEWTSTNRAVLEILSGSQGEHLARWKSLVVFHENEWSKYRARWVVEVISPVLSLGGTPRLRVLLLVGSFPGQIVLHHTPLLENLSFPGARDVSVSNTSHVRKLAFRNALPVRLSTAPFIALTHLILHVPIHCSKVELPNVTSLDLIDGEIEELSLELPILPRVQRISVITYMDDFLPQLHMNHYLTWKSFCLRYGSVRPGLLPSDKFIEDAIAFITSSCSHLEELDIDHWFISTVKANVHHLPKLKRILVLGQELEKKYWYQSSLPSDHVLIDNTSTLPLVTM